MRAKLLLSAALTLALCAASAQMYPERREIRKGNALYEKGEFQTAEERYRRAVEKAPGSYEAAYNLSNSLYKQERYDEAEALAGTLAADSAYMDNAAAAFYNKGNAQFQQRKLQEALESYKESLRRNPDDMEAKFNLAYVQKLLENENENGGGGENDQNQDQDQNSDQNQDQNQNQDQDQQNDNQDQEQDQQEEQDNSDQNSGDPQGDPADQEQQQGGMDRETADQLLDAMQGAEDNTKERVDAQKARVVGRSGKNW